MSTYYYFALLENTQTRAQRKLAGDSHRTMRDPKHFMVALADDPAYQVPTLRQKHVERGMKSEFPNVVAKAKEIDNQYKPVSPPPAPKKGLFRRAVGGIKRAFGLGEARKLRALFEALLENSPFEKASDEALDKKYGYGISHNKGSKTDFGRAANRSSAARALRALRQGYRSGQGVTGEQGADAVHQGWAQTARTNPNQTPEKKAKRAVLADTPYDKLSPEEQQKDRVSFQAVRKEFLKRMRGR